VFVVGNFFLNLAFVVLSTMILGRTGSDELVLGSVRSAGAIGGLMGKAAAKDRQRRQGASACKAR
jgi:hypothetical protein